MAKKRTVIPRRKPPDAEARAASVQGDLFQLVAQTPVPPALSQSFRALGMAIGMKAGDVLETSPDGPMQIVTADGTERQVAVESSDLKIRLSVYDYLRDFHAIDGELVKRAVDRLAMVFKSHVDNSVRLDHAGFIELIRNVVDAARNARLVDYITEAMYPLDSPAFRDRQNQRPLHVKQLLFIKLDDMMDNILPAIRDRFRADANLHHWLNEGLVTEDGYEAFKAELTRKNHEIRTRVEDERGDGLPLDHTMRVPAENRGRLIYYKCKEITGVALNGHEPPLGFIRGAFEDLANDEKDCKVFWHPYGEQEFFPNRPAKGEAF